MCNVHRLQRRSQRRPRLARFRELRVDRAVVGIRSRQTLGRLSDIRAPNGGLWVLPARVGRPAPKAAVAYVKAGSAAATYVAASENSFNEDAQPISTVSIRIANKGR